ncbi:MAG: SpoIIE family protein phosphatase [Clostridia bacterium]|nr:SpoIIE family protein phosphatase [Clostridia bacterium]
MDKGKILVVDDNEQNIELLQGFLEAKDYEILTAYDGAEAIEQITKNDPDLVLLDVIMPGMDGFEVCRKIKFQMNLDFLPVIMVTALNGREEKIKGLEVGADDFISKPLDWTELTVRIKSLLRLKRTHDQLRLNLARLDYQLDLARSIQMGLMGSQCRNDAAEVFYHPVEKVGGDLYEFVKVDEDKCGVLIADCSGYGVPAALMMASVKIVFMGLDKKNTSPSMVLNNLNTEIMNLFSSKLEGLFITAIYMVVDFKNKCISWSNAGHPYPILFQNGGGSYMTPGDMPLGILEKLNYQTHRIPFNEGSLLMLYTDGLAEYFEKGAQMLPENLFPKILSKLGRTSVQERSSFYKGLEADMENFSDDICYIAIRLGD